MSWGWGWGWGAEGAEVIKIWLPPSSYPQSQLQPQPGNSVLMFPLEVISAETNVICWETGNFYAEGVSWEQVSAIP